MKTTRPCLAITLAVLFVVSAAAHAVTVVVNNRPLPTEPPAVIRDGRTLLPLRAVLESLGATVRWQAATQTVTAVRADTTVQMTIGDPTAHIDDRAVRLDVPPQLIGGVTYVPVRFPAEAFGADVGWDPATQVVDITVAARPGAPPPVAPGPVTQTATGVVSAVTGNRLVLAVDRSLQLYRITPSTIILRQGRQAQATELEAGDLAVVQHDGRGNATVVRASFEVVQGTVVAATPSQILLDTVAQPLQVQSQVRVTAAAGEAAQYADIRAGDRVVLRVTPGTDDVWSITLQRPAAEALTVEHNARDIVLGPGDMLAVTAVGPPGGRATFSLGNWQPDLPTRELSRQPGSYRGTFVVPPIETERTEPVIVVLRTPDGRILTANAETPVRFRAERPLPLTLIRPTPGAQVGESVVVEGVTEPGAAVNITISWRGETLGLVEQTGQLVQLRLIANAMGRLGTDPIPLRVPVILPVRNVSYTVTAVAEDARGRRSQLVTVEFTR